VPKHFDGVHIYHFHTCARAVVVVVVVVVVVDDDDDDDDYYYYYYYLIYAGYLYVYSRDKLCP
jgi:hypothetical protein